MTRVLKNIQENIVAGKKMLAVLIDPQKFDPATSKYFLKKIPSSTSHIFIGGSTVAPGDLHSCVTSIRAQTGLPLILFPGDHQQISGAADALLFLSLLSGRNPEYLIGQQIRSIPLIRKTQLEVIPTAYLLIDGGKECAVERVSATKPLSQDYPQVIIDTALAGKFSGKQLIYLEAGSGADIQVASQIISEVKAEVNLPLIVGGGIRTGQQVTAAYIAGADMVVIGTAFENGNFFSV